MDRFAEKANKAAKRLGASTTDYTEASLIYYQQGLSDEEAAAKAETTIKAANVTGQSGEAVSEQLTAVWNGYKVSAEEAELYIDKLAAVAATTASDLEELSTGMSKVASAAATMGVDIDQLNAQLATIVSVTRESPESIGTALKTVYARMSDITAGLDGEVSLDEYTKQMETMGINVLDANGNLRDMGDVIEEIGGKWKSMSREQQTSLAQTIAGTRQYSRMMALFNNWDMYTKALETSANAAGTLNEQNEIYLESTEAHLKRLTAAKEGLFDSLLEADGINPLIDDLTNIVEALEKVVDAAGGMKGALAGVSSLFTRLFSKQIAQNIEPFISNIISAKRNAEQLQAVLKNTENFAVGKGYSTEATEAMRQTQIEMSQYWDVMTTEEIDASQGIIRQIGDITQLQTEWKEASESAQAYFSSIKTHKISKEGNITENQGTNKLLQGVDVSRGLQGLKDDAEGVGGVSKQQQAAAKATLEIYEKQESAIKQMTAAQEKMNEAASKNLTVEKKIASLLENKDDLISASQQALQEELKVGLINEEQYNDAINKLEEYFNKIEEAQQRYNNASDDEKKSAKVQEYGVDAKGLKQNVEGIFSSSQKSAEDFDKVASSMKNAAGAAAALGDQQNKLNISVLKTRKAIQNVTNALNVFSNVAMGFSAIGSIADILESPDLSEWEKAVQVMMSLSMTIPMLTNLYNGLKNVQTAYNIVQIATIANTSKENASVILSTLAKGGNKVASDILQKELKKEVLERLKNGEAIEKENEELLKQALLKNQDNLNNNKLAKSLDKLKGGLGKIGELVQKTGPLKGLTSGMGPAAAGATALGIALAGVAVAAGAVYLSYKNYQHSLEETAEKAKARANESNAAAEAAVEEANKVDELCSSYQNLVSQYDGTAKSLDDLRNKTSDLLKEYGRYDLAVKALTADYAELNEMIKGEQVTANEEVIKTAEQNINDQTHAVSADVWANAKGSERDEVNGKKSLDLGDKKDTDKLDSVLDKYDIDVLDDFGHIDYDQLIQAAIEGGDEFRADLEAINSDAAKRLLEILAQEQDNLNAATESITAKHEAKLENIALEEYNEGDITDVESFNTEVSNMANKAFDAGEFDSYEEAVKWATDYIAKIDELGGKIAGYQALMQQGADNFLPTDLLKSYNQEFEAAQEGIALLEEASGKSIQELIREYGSLDEAMNALVANGSIDSYDKDTTEKLQHVYNSLDFIKSAFGDVELSEEEMFNKLTSDNPLEGAWMDPEKYQGAINEALQYGLDNGIENLYGFFTPEDWEEILNINSAEDRIAKINEKVGKYLNDYKNTFKSSTASIIATQAGTFLEQADYIAPNSLEGNADWQSFETQLEQVKTLFPELQSDVETLMDPAKQGTEEWIQALERVQSEMGGIAEDADGIFTKEDAAGYNLTETKLTEQYNRGDINQEEYQQKFQGAMDYELEELGINQEEFEEYTDAVEDLTEQYELSDEMVQRIAKDNLKLQKTVDTLASDWEEYGDILKSGDKTNIKYAQGIGKIRESVEDMFGTDISDDFIQEHLEEIQQLAEGDLTVFDELQIAAAKDYIASIALDDSQAIENANELMSYLDTIDLENIDIGASLDTTDFGSSLTQMLYDAGMTADEISNALSTIGFEPEVTYLEVPAGSANYDNQRHTYDYTDPITGKHYTGVLDSSLYSDETGMVKIPVINGSKTSFRGSATGAIKPPKSSGGGGGGGGGGSKPKEPDKMDKSNDEIDRYHDINIVLKQLETQFDRLGKAQEKLIGKALIDNLNQQLKILEKQKQTLAQKIELERQEAAELQGDLAKEGVKFNKDGTIANYADVLKAKENYVNSLIEKYNGMSAEEQESYKETVEKAKEDYEKLKDNIDRYDTVITDEIPGLEDQIQDIVDQEIEINVKKFTMGIELRLEMKEAEQDWNKFKRKIIDGMKDDNIFGQGLESLENYRDYFDLGGGQGGTVDALTKQVNNTMAEIQKMQAGEMSNIFGNDMSKAMETLTTYNSELMTQLEDMEDLVESIEQGLLDTMDEVKEKMDAQVEAYEYVNDLLESDMELVQMLYGEDSYEALGNYYAQKHENYKQALDFDKQEVAFWQQEMEAAKASGNEEAYQKALENYREGVNKLNEDVKASVQNIIDSYSNTINQIFDKLDKKMSGKTGGMDSLREEWELINTNADRYLDTINSTYEVQKLQNKYKTSINAAESTKVQQKLNALMEEEIGMLEKKDKLSQYDIDRANMKYDIALKQIALEEAQQNKSSMRMKRDAQGNYSYVYAGDEDDISSKTQELADAQNQLYNLDKDQYRQNMDDIVSYTAEMQEKIKELYEDPTMDPEVRGEREKTIREQYGELINNIIADNESIRANLHESTFDSLSMLYETDADNFRTMTGLENDDWSNMTDDMLNNIQTKMIPTWDGSVQHMIDTFIADGGIGPTIDQVFKDADEALKNYESSLSEVEAAAGISFDAIKNGTDAASESAKELISDNNEIMDQCKEQVEEYKALIAQVKDLATAYDGVRDAAIRAANAAHTLAEEINNQSVSAADDPTIGPNMPSPSGPSADPNGPSGNPTNPASGNGSGDGVLNVGDEVTYTGGKYYEDSYGGGKSGERGPGKKVKVTIIKDDGRPYPIHVESSDSAYGWLKKEQLSGFKSGGFTGSWQGGVDRDDGRLALLHQKELVLNADDTDNFLKAMQDLRKAQNEIKTVSSSGVISAMFNSISDAITAKMQNLQSAQADILNAKGPAGGGLTGTIQNITINADFPEVSDANEIRKAFDQIIGMASQKASNKSR